jgi:tetratricopeptide (TPR) repeat protein
LQALISEFPDEAEYPGLCGATLNNLANVSKLRGKWAEAVRLLDEAVKHQQAALRSNPKHPAFRQNLRNHLVCLAICLTNYPDARLRNPSRAIALANKAIELEPDMVDAHCILGMAHYRAGNWGAAVKALEEALRHDRMGDSQVAFHLAMAYWRLGDKDQARRWYGEAVRRMPKGPPKGSEPLDSYCEDQIGLGRLRAEAEALLGLKVNKP